MPSAIPSSMCRPCSVSRQRTSVSVSSANQSIRSPRCQIPPRLIQPPRFVDDATSGLTVTTWAATSEAPWERSTKKRPNACWVDSFPVCPRPRSAGISGTGRSSTVGRRSRAATSVHRSASAVPGSNAAHGSAASAPSASASCSHWSTVSSAEWLPGWPSVCRRHALIVYAKITDGRSVTASAASKASRSSPRSWPPRSRTIPRRSPSPMSAAASPRRPRRSAASVARRSRWYSSFGISVMRSHSAGWALMRRAVLHGVHVPARRLEHRGEPPGGDVGHDAVERLAVEVDDPQHLAEMGDDRVDDRLPHGALVELRVADERDLPAALRDVEVAGDVAVRERRPDRRGRADADRAGREVRRHRVLQAARIALQAAERAQLGEVAAVELAEQVLDRVQDRRGVRLDGDAVGRAQVVEVQRRHDAHHRGRRRLVAADLHPARRAAHAVGVVDDARREPQDASLDGVEDRDVGVARGDGGAHGRRDSSRRDVTGALRRSR